MDIYFVRVPKHLNAITLAVKFLKEHFVHEIEKSIYIAPYFNTYSYVVSLNSPEKYPFSMNIGIKFGVHDFKLITFF